MKLKNGFYTNLWLTRNQLPQLIRKSQNINSQVKYSKSHFISSRHFQRVRRDFASLLKYPIDFDNPILYVKMVHCRIAVLGILGDVLLSNILMHWYSKLGCFGYAHKVFDEMPKRNLVSWSTLVALYVQHCRFDEALVVFVELRRGCDEKPNEFVLASVVRACAQMGGCVLGAQVHGLVLKTGLSENVYVGTGLIDLYVKVGEVDDARLVFDELKEKSLFTWTTIMTGYGRNGRSDVSLMLFSQMMRDDGNVAPDKYVLSSALSACSILRYLEGGRQIHAYIWRRGAEMDVSVMNVLIDFYVKCGRVRSGRILFDQIVAKDSVSWTTMIAGYMKNGCNVDAVQLFIEMNSLGWKPDDFVCSSVLTSCSSLEALVLGKQVHAYTIKASLEADEYVKNGLIDMYSKCDSIEDARSMFDSVIHSNVVSYNAIIEGYASRGRLLEAYTLFHDMRLKMLHPNHLTLTSLLGAATFSTPEFSKQVHCFVIKIGMSMNLFVSSALIDAYSKCKLLQEARLMFEEINDKDVVVWNAMLSGYALQSEEAFKLYGEFQVAGQKANEFTFVAMVNAASNLASVRNGQLFHGQLVKTGFDIDPYVSNALLDMYAKCGCLDDANTLFSTTKLKDVACWNTMISTYANYGQAERALSLYETMLKEGFIPNYVTFIALISACSHAGLVEDGRKHFETMLKYGIEPGIEHYACMVSLFGRAGKLNDAKDFIEKMRGEKHAIVWRALLSACCVVGDCELGAYAAEMALMSDPSDSGTYVLLSNIYASKGMWAEVKEVRKRMESNLVVKEAGWSY